MMDPLAIQVGVVQVNTGLVTALTCLLAAAVLLRARKLGDTEVRLFRRIGLARRKQGAGLLRRKNAELAALHTFGNTVNASLSLSQTSAAALTGMMQAVPCDLTFLFLCHGERLVLSGVLPEGAGRMRLGLMPDHRVGACLCGLAVDGKQALYATNIHKDCRCTGAECRQAGLRSVAVLPLCRGDEVLGVIGLATDAEHDFEQQGEFLATLASQVAIAIANARLYEATQRELAERRRTEESLAESNRQYQQLVDNARDGIFTLANDGRFLFVNAEFCLMLGYSRDELLHLSIADTYTDAAREDGLLRMTHLGCGKSLRLERPMRRKDGSSVMVESHTWRADEGSIKAIVRDITERQRAGNERAMLEMTLRQREKMDAVGQLAGGIAHDFNNQLGGIMGAAELLGLEVTGARPRQHLNQILQATGRAADLTQQLLAFARKGKILNVEVDMHGVIGEVMALLDRSIDKRISVQGELQAARCLILGDPSQLQSALLNLALNARDAMPSGGTLTFTTSLEERVPDPAHPEIRPGWHLKVSVRDTGTGMGAETQKRLFEPFFTTKDVGKGTGLGLAAVYGTIKSHQGAIAVESQPGEGSTFHLFLPLIAATRLPQQRQPAPEAAVPGRGRVLLVDDESIVRGVGEQMLRSLGYEVVTFPDGDSAVAYYRENWQQVDLILLDMIMPKYGGPETFRLLRQINPEVSVLLVSGYSLDSEAQTVLEQGACGFIQKPFRRVELSQRVAAVVQGHNSQPQARGRWTSDERAVVVAKAG
jgi:PAS domain S-box-containing protein